MSYLGITNNTVNWGTLKTKKHSTQTQNNISIPSKQVKTVKPGLEHLKANFISFSSNNLPAVVDHVNEKEVNHITSLFDEETTSLWNEAKAIARKSKSKELCSCHFVKAAALSAQQKLVKGKTALDGFLSMVEKTNDKIIGNEYNELDLGIQLEDLISDLDNTITNLPKDIQGPKEVSQELKNNLKSSLELAKQSWNGFNNDLRTETLLVTIASKKESELTDFLLRIHSINHSPDGADIPSHNGARPPVARFDEPETDMNKMAKLGALFNFDNYKQKAKVVANAISANRNINFIYEQGSKPEFIAHSFARMVEKGEFANLKSDNTEIKLWDMNKILLQKGKDGVVKEILAAGKKAKAEDKQVVIFAKDFHILLNTVNAPVLFNSNNLGKNLHIVGMTQDDIYGQVTAPVMGQKKAMELQWQNKFEEIRVVPPSPKQAKEMMVEDARLTNQVTINYPGDIVIDPKAINKVVDVASTSRTGALPGKALDLLNLVIANKCNATGDKVGSIQPEDVDKFLSFYPEFKKSASSGSNQFSLIADTGIRMKDVGGAAQAKDVVNELLDFIKNPEKFEKTGAKIPKGILLSGTPGNGKTHTAKAIAGEAGVPFISVSGSEFVEKYVGVGASRVRELFDFARQQAASMAEPGKKGTTIIFIDEFDALGRKRGEGGSGREAEQTLDQLLVEMDGLKPSDNVNIIVLAATNRPDLLDTALTERPGRFDHKINVPNPANDPQARYEILDIHARKKNIAGNRKAVLKELADRTAGASGARLADIINKASIIAAKDNREALTINDFVEAKLESVAGRITNLSTPGWYNEMTIAHECGHALVKQVLLNVMDKEWKKASEIDVITTDPRGNYAGAVYSKPGENPSHTFESVFTEIASGFGGYSVEKIIYEMKGSNGISSDLKQTTGLAKKAISEWGMGPNVGAVSLAEDPDVKNMMNAELKQDMRLILNAARQASDEIVTFFQDFIENTYVEKYKTNAGKGGNNLSGGEFQKELNQWIKTEAGQEKLEQLQTKLKELIENTQKGDIASRRRIGFIQEETK